MASRFSEYLPDWNSSKAENIMYGDGSPLEAILSLAIGDGTSSREHRDSIFSEEFYYTGCATEPHKYYGSQTVLTYTGKNDTGAN